MDEHGADVNAKNKDGSTALLFASFKGHLEILKYVVENGADLNAKNDKGDTGLIQGCHIGFYEIVMRL